MRRLKITLILIISPLFLLKGQPRYDLADMVCFKSVMMIGFQNGFWDTSKIDSTSSDCRDYYSDRLFKVVNDTLQIIHVADTVKLQQQFFGLKAFICSDSLIKADLYLDAVLKGKLAKRAKKDNSDTTIGLIRFKVWMHGDSCSMGFRQAD